MITSTGLLRRKADKTGHVITVPLITDSTGKKFGKSEGNAVWLDADKTSPCEMYQFWLNIMDGGAAYSLKIFTFLSLEEITEVEKEFDVARHECLTRKVLVREIITLVHDEETYKQTLKIAEQLFAGNIRSLSAKKLKQGLNNVPNCATQVGDSHNIVGIPVATKISPLKRQAREDVQDGTIYIDGERVQDLTYTLSDDDKVDSGLTVIRRGKKKYLVLAH